MAALDFPNSPTTNQQYAAPNGVTYQYDGAAWVVTGGPPGQLWTASGSTLVPTDTTKIVAVPGPASGATVMVGSGSAKGRLQTNPNAGAGSVGIFANRDWTSGNAQDDATKPSWGVSLQESNDWCVIQRQPSGSTTPTTLLTLDNAGNLTIPGNFTQLGQYARVTRSTAQSVANITVTTMTFDTLSGSNPGGMWNAGSPDRLTTQVAGWYIIGAAGQMPANATGGRRLMTVFGSASSASASSEVPANASALPQWSPVAAGYMAVGTAIQVQVYQDSGAAQNVSSLTLWAVRIG